MLNEQSVIDRIERAQTERPHCDCGRTTTTVYREGAIWLECAVVTEPVGGRARRLWTVVTDPGHVHAKVVDVPAPQEFAA
jgi:hypothetical protein